MKRRLYLFALSQARGMAGTENFEFLPYGSGAENGAGKPKRLVFTMHGYGRNAHFMEKVALDIEQNFSATAIMGMHAPEQLDLPDRLDVSDMNIPDELIDDDGTLSEDMQRQWFSMHGGTLRMWYRIWRLRSKVNAFIDSQKDRYGLKDKDIVIIGFSQGGAVALYSALARKKPVACVIGHSTVYWGRMPVRSRPPVYLLHGTKDTSISQDLYDESEKRLNKAGLQTETFTFPNQVHYISTRSRQKIIEILSDYLV